MRHNLKVAQTFSKGARTYDQKAHVQSHVNEALAQMIQSREPQLNSSSVLEVGCGTGDLSKTLSPQCHRYVLSDISYDMTQVAQGKAPQAEAVVVDGEQLCFTATFDIIVSSLTLHWFQNPEEGLNRLVGCLKPGGRLYLTAMGSQSFYEWRTAHTVLNAPCGTPEFIPLGALKAWLPAQGPREVYEAWIAQEIEKPKDYFKNLKTIGAGLSHPGHKPLPPSIFKKVLKKFAESQKLSFQILYATYQKPIEFREE